MVSVLQYECMKCGCVGECVIRNGPGWAGGWPPAPSRPALAHSYRRPWSSATASRPTCGGPSLPTLVVERDALTVGDTLGFQRRRPGEEEGVAVCADDEVKAAHPLGQLQVRQVP